MSTRRTGGCEQLRVKFPLKLRIKKEKLKMQKTPVAGMALVL
jgi:hypothetical protein